MLSSITPYVSLLIAAMSVSVVLAHYSWRRRAVISGAVETSLLMVAIAIWSLAYALSLSAPTFSLMVWWDHWTYLGVVTAPPLWLMFVFRYTGEGRWLTRSRLVALAIIPVITLALVFTNAHHHLIFRMEAIRHYGTIHLLHDTFAPWFWIHATYSYALLLIGIVLLLRASLHAPRLYRQQTYTVLLALCIPLFSNFLDVFGLDVCADFDLTPFTFVLTGMAVGWGIVRQRLLDLAPIARTAVFDGMYPGVIVLDTQDRVVDLNPAAQQFINQQAMRAVLGKHIDQVFSDCPELVAVCREHGERQAEMCICHGDERRHYVASISPLCGWRNRRLGHMIVIYDITKRKRAEEELLTEKERLATTLRSIVDAVVTTDSEGCVTLMNCAAEEITGWLQRDVLHRPLFEVLPFVHEETGESCRNLLQEYLIQREFTDITALAVLTTRTGDERVIEYCIAPLCGYDGQFTGLTLVFRDITHLRALEADRRRAEKLESLGILAGGIAHDYNNLFTAILANLSLVRTATHEPYALQKLIDVERVVERAQNLTQQLLTFSRGEKSAKTVANIAKLLQETVRLTFSGIEIDIAFVIDETAWPVIVHAEQIGQVIYNLILNAAQAMPHGGTVTITVDNCQVSDIPELAPGPYVRVIVSDTGVGIPHDELPKIFDPYYTTKETGSGLGLAVSYAIVRNHRGLIRVASQPDRGSTFTVYLPASPEAVLACEHACTGTPERALTRKVLVMDDDEMVREILTECLQLLGFDVIATADGVEMLRRYRDAVEQGSPFDVVIMDLRVRDAMGGEEAVRELLAFDPQACAIASSGDSKHPIMQHYREYGFRGAISKPFQICDLRATIDRVLTGEVSV